MLQPTATQSATTMKIIILTLLLAWTGSVSAADLSAADQPIALKTGTGKINGSLVLPVTTGKPLVALIIAGSGPTDRYGNSRIIKGKNDSLKGIATALASAGTASARYDKRGVAASADATASESDLRFNTYVRDAAV